MSTIHDQATTIAALIKVDRAGWTADLLAAISHAVPHRSDLERHPDRTIEVRRFARLAQSMLGGSLQSWEAAAREALLPGGAGRRYQAEVQLGVTVFTVLPSLPRRHGAFTEMEAVGDV